MTMGALDRVIDFDRGAEIVRRQDQFFHYCRMTLPQNRCPLLRVMRSGDDHVFAIAQELKEFHTFAQTPHQHVA